MRQILFLLLIGFSAFGQKNSNSVFDKKIIEIEIFVKFHNIVDDISSPSGFSLKA